MSYRVLALADLHGNIKAVKTLINKIKTRRPSIDLILIAGDMPKTTPLSLMLQYMITHPLRALSKPNYTKWVYKGKGRKKFVKEQITSVKSILQLLSTLSVPIVYVPGNVDTFETIDYIKNSDGFKISILDHEVLHLDNFSIFGHGGSMFTPKKYPAPLCDLEFPPKVFSKQTTSLINTKIPEDKFRILLTHEPPSFYLNNSNKGLMGGSPVISKLIKNIRPQIALFGHWHELPLSKFDSSLDIHYFNPGPLACYNYGIIDFSNANISTKLERLLPSTFDSTNIIYKYRNNPNQLIENIRFV